MSKSENWIEKAQFADGELDQGRPEYEELLQSIPRLRVLKSTSKLVKSGKYPAGTIYSDAHEDILGEVKILTTTPPQAQWTKPVEFIPIAFQIEWIEFDDDFNVVYRTHELQYARERWGQDKEFKHRFLHVGMLIDNMPIILSMTGYDMVEGRQFYRSTLKPKLVGGSFRRIPIRAQKWELTTAFNPKNDHFSPSFRYVGVVDEKFYKETQALSDDFDLKRLAPPVEENGEQVSEENARSESQDRLPF